MYHRGSILKSYLDKDIYTSCKAAKLATVQAILPLSLISTKLSVSGRINSSAPVSLFMTVCSDKSFFSAAKTRTMPNIFTVPISPIHTQSHTGSDNTGRSFIIHTRANTVSAAVSRDAPKTEVWFLSLATVPSIMSVQPAATYRE